MRGKLLPLEKARSQCRAQQREARGFNCSAPFRSPKRASSIPMMFSAGTVCKHIPLALGPQQLLPSSKAFRMQPMSRKQRRMPGMKDKWSEQGRLQPLVEGPSSSGNDSGSNTRPWQDLEEGQAGQRGAQATASSTPRGKSRKIGVTSRKKAPGFDPRTSGSRDQTQKPNRRSNLGEVGTGAGDAVKYSRDDRLKAWNELASAERTPPPARRQRPDKPTAAAKADSARRDEHALMWYEPTRESTNTQGGAEQRQGPGALPQVALAVPQGGSDSSGVAEQGLRGGEALEARVGNVERGREEQPGSKEEVLEGDGRREEAVAFVCSLGASPEEASALWERSLDTQVSPTLPILRFGITTEESSNTVFRDDYRRKLQCCVSE